VRGVPRLAIAGAAGSAARRRPRLVDAAQRHGREAALRIRTAAREADRSRCVRHGLP